MAAPVLQALLVADQIYQDQSTGKFVICGIFGTIFFMPHDSAPAEEMTPNEPADEVDGGDAGASAGAEGGGPKVPVGQPPVPQSMKLNRLIRAGSPYAYVSLTEIHGQRSFEMRYVDLNENAVIFSFEFKVECRNPLETVQLSLPLPVLPVPHEGVFVLELLCGGELLGSHRILTKRQSKP